MTTKHKLVSTHRDAFRYNTVINLLLFVRSAAPVTVHPITTTCGNWYPLTDTPKTRPPIMDLLPTQPEALGAVVTTVGDSATMFAAIQADAVARFMCSHLQLVEGRIGFEITLHGVYIVLGFLSFLR
jgi:hypothetical protein